MSKRSTLATSALAIVEKWGLEAAATALDSVCLDLGRQLAQSPGRVGKELFSKPQPLPNSRSSLGRVRQWQLGAIEIAAHKVHHQRGRVANQCAVVRRRARQHVIDHDGGNGGDEAERGR